MTNIVDWLQFGALGILAVVIVFEMKNRGKAAGAEQEAREKTQKFLHELVQTSLVQYQEQQAAWRRMVEQGLAAQAEQTEALRAVCAEIKELRITTQREHQQIKEKCVEIEVSVEKSSGRRTRK